MNPALPLLILAMIAVESHGDNAARGPNGESGCLQITQAALDDVNESQGTVFFHHADTLDRDRSVAICKLYLARWATAHRLGHEPTLEDMARIWNGGPYGHFKGATLVYWVKVRRELRALGVVTP